jgi:hypothetical protein
MSLKVTPTIVMPQSVYDKVMWWVNHAEGEVSGMGTVTIDEETGEFRIDDAVLLNQSCTAATTELDADAVGKAEFAFKDHTGSGMRWWWHSHVNMGVFWSGTDETTIEELGEHGWFLATVFNKKEETKSCIYQGKPFGLFQNDIDLVIESPAMDEELIAGWRADFADKVRVPKATTTYGAGYWGRGGAGDWGRGGAGDWYDYPELDTKKKADPPTPPLASHTGVDKLVYTSDTADIWLKLYYDVQDDYNATICEVKAESIGKKLDYLEEVLDEFINKELLTINDVYGWYTDGNNGTLNETK